MRQNSLNNKAESNAESQAASGRSFKRHGRVQRRRMHQEGVSIPEMTCVFHHLRKKPRGAVS